MGAMGLGTAANRRFVTQPKAAVIVSGTTAAMPGSIQTLTRGSAGFQALLAGTIAGRQAPAPTILTSGVVVPTAAAAYLSSIAGQPTEVFVVGYSSSEGSSVQSAVDAASGHQSGAWRGSCCACSLAAASPNPARAEPA
jgi:hypothetical protein